MSPAGVLPGQPASFTSCPASLQWCEHVDACKDTTSDAAFCGSCTTSCPGADGGVAPDGSQVPPTTLLATGASLRRLQQVAWACVEGGGVPACATPTQAYCEAVPSDTSTGRCCAEGELCVTGASVPAAPAGAADTTAAQPAVPGGRAPLQRQPAVSPAVPLDGVTLPISSGLLQLQPIAAIPPGMPPTGSQQLGSPGGRPAPVGAAAVERAVVIPAFIPPPSIDPTVAAAQRIDGGNWIRGPSWC